jgi:hypothetical protein
VVVVELVLDDEVVVGDEVVLEEEVVADEELEVEDEVDDDELEVELDDEVLVVEVEPLSVVVPVLVVAVALLVAEVELVVGVHDSRWDTTVPEIGRFRLEIGVPGVVSTLNVYSCPPTTVTVMVHTSADASGELMAAPVPSAPPRIPKKRSSFALACNAQSSPIRGQTVRKSSPIPDQTVRNPECTE